MELVHLKGMNGDRIDLTGVGQATQNPTPSIFNIVQIYKITGGAGQYAGTRGTITLNWIMNIASGLTSSAFEGYILVQ